MSNIFQIFFILIIVVSKKSQLDYKVKTLDSINFPTIFEMANNAQK